MNQGNDNYREQMEVRLVALLLGEASEFERAELEASMEKDASLTAFYNEMKGTLGLVQEASKKFTEMPASTQKPTLSPERREKLMATFKVVKPKELKRERKIRRWVVPLGIAAGLALVVAALSLPRLGSSSLLFTLSDSASSPESAGTLGIQQRAHQAKSPSRRAPLSVVALSTPPPTAATAAPLPKGPELVSEKSFDSVEAEKAPENLAIFLPPNKNEPETAQGTSDFFAANKTKGAADAFDDAGNQQIDSIQVAKSANGNRFVGRYAYRQDQPEEALKKEANLDGVVNAGAISGDRIEKPSAAAKPGIASTDQNFDIARNDAQKTPEASSLFGAAVESPQMHTKTIQVDPKRFIPALNSVAGTVPVEMANGRNGGGGGGGGGYGVQSDGSLNPSGLSFSTTTSDTQKLHNELRNYLADAGVNGGEDGKSVFFNDKSGTVLLRGTKEEVEAGEKAVNALNQPPSQTPTEAKLAESKPDESRALGFDWYQGNTSGIVNGPAVNAPLGTRGFGGYQVPKNAEEEMAPLDIKLPAPAFVGTKADLSLASPPAAAAPAPAPIPSDEAGKQETPVLRDVPVLGRLSRGLAKRKVEAQSESNYGETRVPAESTDAVGKIVTRNVGDNATYELDFRHMPVDQVIDEYSKLADLTVLRPNQGAAAAPSATPPITLESKTPLSRTEALKSMEEALAKNGVTIVPMGGKIAKAVPESLASTAGGLVPLRQKVAPAQSSSASATSASDNVLTAGLRNSDRVQLAESKAVRRTEPQLRQRLAKAESRPEAATSLEATKKLQTEQLGQAAEKDAPIRKASGPIPTPQPETATAENAFSTFSLNVSDVTFKLAQASLQNNALPDPASIRVEEFVNAFNYRDPAPMPGARLAFAWERAHYPFAHNRDILRLGVQTAARGRDTQKPLNLVILLDNSGSMERPDRVAILREALKVLAAQLRPQDRISVIAFARTAHLWVDGMAGGHPDEFLAKVLNLNPEGGTNLEDAMNLGYETAARYFTANGVNRVILLTDGAANLGNVEPEDLKKKVVSNRQKGIALDCYGIGWEGYNDDLLEVLSRNGDGRYAFLNAPEQAGPEFADQLAGALNVAAADVKTQVEFNPARVTSWRQIGYAKHQLTKEQFRDNTVDAAEIAAAEQGNALYVIEVDPRGSGPLGTVRVRFKVPETGEYIEQAWPLAYQPQAPALESATPAMRLAVTAAAFGEWLSASPYAAEVTPAALQACLTGVPETFAPDPRPGSLKTMIRQAEALAGK